jgi:hypothetical protein
VLCGYRLTNAFPHQLGRGGSDTSRDDVVFSNKQQSIFVQQEHVPKIDHIDADGFDLDVREASRYTALYCCHPLTWNTTQARSPQTNNIAIEIPYGRFFIVCNLKQLDTHRLSRRCGHSLGMVRCE